MSTPLELTPGDVRVFWWLWLLRVLTLDQIRRLRYFQEDSGRLSSADNVRKRLSRLAQAGYLLGERLQTTHERVYFLTEKALGPLREHHGLEQRHLFRPRAGETLVQLLHPLMVSECAVRVVESVRGTDVGLPALEPLGLPFLHTHAVADPAKRRHVERYVTQEDLFVPGEPEPLRIRPDLVFGLAVGPARRLFFLEADRGAEPASAIALKLRAYAHYRGASEPEQTRYLWQRYGEFQDFRVLVVTTTAQRIANLRRSLRSQSGFELAAFTTLQQLKEGNVVYDDVWITADGNIKAFVKR